MCGFVVEYDPHQNPQAERTGSLASSTNALEDSISGAAPATESHPSHAEPR